jgi:tetratricopeptide (TPR) repeat protein
MIFFGLVISFIVVFVFQAFRLFLPQTLSFGVLGDKIGNVLGSWNTLGILAGFGVVSSLFFLEFFSVSKRENILLWSLVGLSILFVILVNLQIAWVILGVFSLFIFVYRVYFSFQKREDNKIKFPTISFSIVMISLLFLIAGQFIGGILPSRFGISNNEIRPSFSSTMLVAKQTLMKDPILGSGPNRFAQMWDLNKPNQINNTLFWKTSFNQGYGILPSFAVTTGIVGILAWLAFIGLLFFVGAKYFINSQKENNLNMDAVLFYVMSMFLFVSAFFFPIGSVMFLLAFAFIGIFIGLSTANKEKEEITISFLDNSKKSLFSIVGLVFVLLITASLSFKYVESFVSVPYFQKSLDAQTVPIAQANLAKAITLYPNDLYLRTYANVILIKINNLVSKDTTVSSLDKIELQSDINQVITAAGQAVAYDSTNYLNYKMLGFVYETISSYGVEDAFPKSIESYEKALALNPQNPELKLDMARVSFSNKKVDDAKKYTQEAIALKADYIDGLITMAQILKSEGNNSLAASYAEQALSLDVNNKDLAQYVNSLKGNTAPAPEAKTEDTKDVKVNKKAEN